MPESTSSILIIDRLICNFRILHSSLASIFMILPALPLPFLLGDPSNFGPLADPVIISPSTHVLTTMDGSSVQKPQAGEQVVIGNTLTNHDNTRDWAAVAITEVRDSSGITIQLSWQSTIVSAGGAKDMGISWIPEHADTYTIRTFPISSLDKPQVLGIVVSTEVTVSI